MQEGPQPATSDERTWAMLAHLGAVAGLVLGVGTVGWLAPLVIWLMYKDKSPFVAFHALEELFFQIAWVVIMIVAAIILTMTCVGILLLPLVGLVPLIWSVIAAVKANNGEWYSYPVVGEMALKNIGVNP